MYTIIYNCTYIYIILHMYILYIILYMIYNCITTLRKCLSRKYSISCEGKQHLCIHSFMYLSSSRLCTPVVAVFRCLWLIGYIYITILKDLFMLWVSGIKCLPDKSGKSQVLSMTAFILRAEVRGRLHFNPHVLSHTLWGILYTSTTLLA